MNGRRQGICLFHQLDTGLPGDQGIRSGAQGKGIVDGKAGNILVLPDLARLKPMGLGAQQGGAKEQENDGEVFHGIGCCLKTVQKQPLLLASFSRQAILTGCQLFYSRLIMIDNGL